MRLTKTLRSVAGFEALKGALVLLAGFDLLAFMGRDLARFINQVVTHFHLNPANRLPRIFLDAYENITDSHRVLLAAFALAYASVRFVEAYGLWWGRRWAEWFAALSAGIYLPFELYELSRRITWIASGALATNIILIGLMVAALRRSTSRASVERT